jgi:hypothetical protein
LEFHLKHGVSATFAELAQFSTPSSCCGQTKVTLIKGGVLRRAIIRGVLFVPPVSRALFVKPE